MKAKFGIPLMLGVAAALSTAVLYPQVRQQQAAAAWQQTSPDRYRFPYCHNDTGWVLYRSKVDYNWYTVAPDSVASQRVTGHWSRNTNLTNLVCEES